MSEPIIRNAEVKDLDGIVGLCNAHAIFEKTTYDSTNKKNLLKEHLFGENKALECIVAEQNEQIIGYVTYMKQFSTWDAEFYVYLDCLYLTEESRGKGLGYRLMNEVKQYALSENCRIVQWQTPDFNVSAVEFYNRLGGHSKPKERFTWEIY